MQIRVDQYPYLDSALLFSKVAHQPWAVMLDSGVLDSKRRPRVNAEYDVLAIKPALTLVTHEGSTKISGQVDGNNISLDSELDPITLLESYIPVADTSDLGLAYLPGAIGYFSYDLARYFEQLPDHANNDEQLPEMAMGIYHAVMVIDHRNQLTQLVYLQGAADVRQLCAEWRGYIDEALAGKLTSSSGQGLQCSQARENIDRHAYQDKFDRVRSYTIEGDCYQVNLTKQFAREVHGDAWASYQKLRSTSPAPFGAFFNFPFAQVLSNSPESFIRCRSRQVETSPIKGTRPRDHTNAVNDLAIADELRNSAKDRAENLMIVDLMRNDLSKSCKLGSVKVPELFALHSFSNVHHLVSKVIGVLEDDLHALDLLRDCFPGGSITGAPKLRSMEIIEELEPDRRGLYCGAIGYVGADGDLETNIAIRTIVIKDGVARYSAGGGLVIDSDVDEEYQEIIDKASMMNSLLSMN